MHVVNHGCTSLCAVLLLASGAAAAGPAASDTPPSTPSTAAPAGTTPPVNAPPSAKTTPAGNTAAPTKTTAPAKSAASAKTAAPVKKKTGEPTRYLPNRFAGRAGLYYKSVWGIDGLTVKLTESGQMVRFAWRVLDPALAKPLSDKEAKPSLIDPQAGVSLVVPTMENIGMLRQAQTPEAGRAYWMAFSNKGRIVKKGDRVNVVIGQFRAEGLAVDD